MTTILSLNQSEQERIVQDQAQFFSRQLLKILFLSEQEVHHRNQSKDVKELESIHTQREKDIAMLENSIVTSAGYAKNKTAFETIFIEEIKKVLLGFSTDTDDVHHTIEQAAQTVHNLYTTKEAIVSDEVFKQRLTTFMLAKAYCGEVAIHDRKGDRDKRSNFKDRLSVTGNQALPDTASFFDQLKKHTRFTFIDMGYDTLGRTKENVHIWLFVLLSEKTGDENAFKGSEYFDFGDADCFNSFNLTNKGLKLFQYMFNAAAKLHRHLTNNRSQDSNYEYSFDSMEDIYNLLVYKKYTNEHASMSKSDSTEFDSLLDVTQALCHVGSQKFYKDFDAISNKSLDSEKPRTDIFSIQELYDNEVLKYAEQVISKLGLQIMKEGTLTPLDGHEFLGHLNKDNSRSISCFDKDGNPLVFTGRSKTLESIINKILNSPQYSHIEAFNDLVATRIVYKKQEAEETDTEYKKIKQQFITTLVSYFSEYDSDPQVFEREKILINFKLKGRFDKELQNIKDACLLSIDDEQKTEQFNTFRDRYIELEKNTKTSSNYNEAKITGKGHEIQLVPAGNNTTGSSDDALYGLQKVFDNLMRTAGGIETNDSFTQSLQHWITGVIQEKRGKLVHDLHGDDAKHVALFSLINELYQEEYKKMPQGSDIGTSLPFLFALEYAKLHTNYEPEIIAPYLVQKEKTAVTQETIDNRRTSEHTTLRYIAEYFSKHTDIAWLSSFRTSLQDSEIKKTAIIQRNFNDEANIEPIYDEKIEAMSDQLTAYFSSCLQQLETQCVNEFRMLGNNHVNYETIQTLLDAIKNNKPPLVKQELKRLLTQSILRKKSKLHKLPDYVSNFSHTVQSSILHILSYTLPIFGDYHVLQPHIQAILKEYHDIYTVYTTFENAASLEEKSSLMKAWYKGIFSEAIDPTQQQRIQNIIALLPKKVLVTNAITNMLDAYLIEYITNSISKRTDFILQIHPDIHAIAVNILKRAIRFDIISDLKTTLEQKR